MLYAVIDFPVPCYLNSDKLFITQAIDIATPSGIQTWDHLIVCLYLNLKHGDLDHSATMAGSTLNLLILNNTENTI